MKSTQLTPLITKIYDAALDPSLWEDFMLAAGDTLKGTTGFLAMFDSNQPRTNMAKVTRFAPDIFDHYMKHFSQERDSWYQLIHKHCVTGSIFTGSELIADEELRKTPMFNEVLKPLEGGYLVGCLLDGSETLSAAYTLSRPMNGPNFTKRDKQIMGMLAPHLRRAYLLHRKYSVCQQAQLSFQEALHRSQTPTILLNAKGRLVFMNKGAEKIVNQADGVSCIGGTLQFEALRHSQTFDTLVGQATLTSQQQGRHPGGGMRVERPSERAPYQLIVTPLNLHSDHSQLAPDAAVCIFLHDPDLEEILSEKILRALYGFTPAEAKLAQLLSAGKTPIEICQIQDVRIPTVRSHLRQMFEKTETATQAQLIRLLIRGPGAVAS